MSDSILRKQIIKMIKEEISKNKQITREGLFDRIIDRIGRAQKRANDKRFIKGLEKIARTPDGKKKVEDYIKASQHIEKVTADAEDLMDKYGL